MAPKPNEGGSSSNNKRSPGNLMEQNAFVAMICDRGKRFCSLYVNLDGHVAMTYEMSDDSVTVSTKKPTFDLMGEELHKFISANSIEGCVVGMMTDKYLSEFVERFAIRLFQTEKLKDVKYTLYDIGMSYESFKITARLESLSFLSVPFDPNEDPLDGPKSLGQFKNWRVSPFFHDEVCALSKPTFTLSISLNGAIRVAGSGLEKVIEISPKPTMYLKSQELFKLISDHSVEGCIVGILRGHNYVEAQFLEFFAHSLFQTGKLKEVKYTFHWMEKRNTPKTA